MDVTLPDGQIKGETKIIIQLHWANPSAVTILHHETSSPEVATFDADGETLVLVWNGTKWLTVKATCTFV